MRHLLVFSKKELVESRATGRLYLLLAVFFLFGIISPLLAKLAPQIIESLAESGQLGGLDLAMPEATALDAWTQFYKNINQMGMLLLMIIFASGMAGELARGTLIMLLAKGLPRFAAVLGKFITASLLWLVAYLFSASTCYLYTNLYWEPVGLAQILPALLGPWLFGVLLLALLILGGVVFASTVGSLLTCLVFVLACNLLALLPQTAAYNPLTVLSAAFDLLTAKSMPREFLAATAVCLALIVVAVGGALAVFGKKSL